MHTVTACAGKPGDRSTILVFGGGSTLGTEVVNRFSMGGWRVVTLDYYDASVECGGVNGCALPEPDTNAPVSLALPAGAPARTQASVATRCVESALCGTNVDFVVNATLGYAPDGDNVFDAWEYMQRTSVESSLIAVALARRFLSNKGMLALLGSVAALPTTKAPALMGFACAKAAVHQMVHQLAMSQYHQHSTVALVPEVLDTPLHRAMNGGQSDINWTPCEVVASKLLAWAEDIDARPPSGSLVSISTTNNDDVNMKAQHRFRIIEEASFVRSAQL